MSDTPEIRVTIAAPPSEVWDALRDRERIRHWHGWEFEGGPDGGLEQEIELIYFTDVETDERGILLNGDDRVDIEAVDGGTQVTLTRAAPSDDPEWAGYYDEITEGWITFLQQLRFAVERHPRDARRTVFLAGPVSASPAAVLGAGDLVPEEEYELDLPDGARRGRVHFRSEHQLGLVVDDWGDGLLVLSHDPAKSVGMALLSLYDVDDTRRSQLEAQWTEWWTTIAV
ncbi:SRPBCC family protein [Microbacterium sp. 179-I 3D3 NHS]|uniref:SRPBCC family protein n=1 Tax=Microbacterium sp. 179-I 3D3 NHS TaxID=3142382 RepID=UPI00399EF697